MIIDNLESMTDTLISYTDGNNDDIILNQLKEMLVDFRHTKDLSLTNYR